MPRKSEYNIAAQHFKDLVINSLDELLNRTGELSISWATVRDHLLEKIPLGREDYGFPKGKNSGRTNVDKWVYQAFTLLDKEGALKKGGERGYWSLSFKGVQKAVTIQQNLPSLLIPFQTSEEETQASLSLNLSWPQESPHQLERFLEKLLLKEASCFGFFSEEAPCQNCLLRVSCSRKLREKLLGIEDELKDTSSPERSQKKKETEVFREKEIIHRTALLNHLCPICLEKIEIGKGVAWKAPYGELHKSCVEETL